MTTVKLNDSSAFELVSGLWKSDRLPLTQGRVLRSTNFSGDGLLDFSDVVQLDVEERHAAKRQLRDGDIIIERSGGGPKQPVGRVALFKAPDEQAYFSSNFTTTLRIRDQNLLDPEFVSLYLHALYLNGDTETLQRATTGIRNLDWQEYLNFEIPKFALERQRSIRQLLSKVREAYCCEKNLLLALRELKQQVMRELFTRGIKGEVQRVTEFGNVPESWDIEPLDQIAIVQTGAAKGRKFVDAEVIEVPYLRVANVQDGHLDLREMKTIKIRQQELSRFQLKDGDVVLTEGGDFDKLGRGFIWRSELKVCIHQNHVFAVRANRDRLQPEFLAYLTQSAYGKAYFLKVAHKTTNLACINSTKLKAFPVLVPSREEQTEIVNILKAIDQVISIHQKKHSVVDEIFQSLLNRVLKDEFPVDELEQSPQFHEEQHSKTKAEVQS